MEGVRGKAGCLGAGLRPSPEMPPHPWHQAPPRVSGSWLGPSSPPLLWMQGHRGRGQGCFWGPVSWMFAGPGHMLGVRLWMLWVLSTCCVPSTGPGAPSLLPDTPQGRNDHPILQRRKWKPCGRATWPVPTRSPLCLDMMGIWALSKLTPDIAMYSLGWKVMHSSPCWSFLAT